MTNPKYTMITEATCDSAFLGEAVPLVATLAGELISEAGAVGTRAGTLVTGQDAGCLFLAQTYAEIGGIERAFDHYAASGTYDALVGSGHIQVKMRALIKLEDLALANPSSETPGYLVLTRWRSADPMTDRARPILPVFEANGAMMSRYGTSIAGPAAGVRVLGVAYPSMDAIEKTYAALAENADYLAFVGDVEILSRNIIRVVA